jgi:hypothetical protein
MIAGSDYRLRGVLRAGEIKELNLNAGQFQPGQSGNPGGGVREKRFRAALERAIAQDDGKRLRGAAEKLLDLADAGEAWAVKELRDTLDGKPAQEITGKDGGPLVVIQATAHDEKL